VLKARGRPSYIQGYSVKYLNFFGKKIYRYSVYVLERSDGRRAGQPGMQPPTQAALLTAWGWGPWASGAAAC
jgi:hypothetical protein